MIVGGGASSGLVINGGRLRITTSFSVRAGILTLNGGVLEAGSTNTVEPGGELRINGGELTGNGSIDVGQAPASGSRMTWSRGIISGMGEITILRNSVLLMDGTGDRVLDGRTITNLGRIDITARGSLIGRNASRIVIGPSANLDIGSSVEFRFISEGPMPSELVNDQASSRIQITNSSLVVMGFRLVNRGRLEVGTPAIAYVCNLSLTTSSSLSPSGTVVVEESCGLDFAGGTHTVPDGMSLTLLGRLSVSGGTLNFSRNLTLWILSVSGGTFNNTGSVTLQKPYPSATPSVATWNGGTLNVGGGVNLRADSRLNITGAADKVLSGTQLTSNGPITWTGTGNLQLSNGAVFTVQPGVILDAQSNAGVIAGGGAPPTFTNRGTIRKSGAGSVSRFATGVAFQNLNVVDVQSGRLALSSGGTHNNTFAVAAPGTLELAGGSTTFGTSSTINGLGAVLFSGGTTTIAGIYNVGTTTVSGTSTVNFASNVQTTNANIGGGTLTGAGSFNVTGQLTWTGGTLSGSGSTVIATAGQLIIDGAATKTLDGRPLNNAGSIAPATWTGTGNLQLRNGAVFTQQSNATFEIRTDAPVEAGPGADPTFTNAGTIRKLAGNGVTRIAVPLVNAGMVEVQSGTVVLANDNRGSGTYRILANARLDLVTGAHTFTASSSITGAGTVAFSGGGAEIRGSYTPGATEFNGGSASFTPPGPGCNITLPNLSFFAGTISGPPGCQINVTSQLLIASNAVKFLDFISLNNRGTGVWRDAGDVGLRNAAALNNVMGATFDARSNARLTWVGGAFGSFTNTGTLQKTVAATTTTVTSGVTFDNRGLARVQSGVFTIADGSTTTGFSVDSGARLDFTGTFNLSAGTSVTGAGDIHFVSGTTTVLGSYTPTGTTRVLGGLADFRNPVSISRLAVSAGTMRVSGAATLTQRFDWTGGTLTGSGVTTVAGGASQLAISGSDPKLLGGRSLRAEGTSSWTGTGSILLDSATLTNAGTFTAQSTGAVAWLGGAPAFVNQGTLIHTGAGETIVAVRFTNPGILDIQDGTVFLASLFTNYSSATNTLVSGTYRLRGTLRFIGADVRNLTANLTLLGPGNARTKLVDEEGNDGLANLSGIGAGGVLALLGITPFLLPPNIGGGSVIIDDGGVATWGGGEWRDGTTTIGPNGTLNFLPKADKVLNNHRVDNHGAINDQGAGSMGIANGSSILNQGPGRGRGGTYNLQGASRYYGTGTPGRFLNQNRLFVNEGAALQFLSGFSFDQQGEFELRSGGSWYREDEFSNRGTLLLQPGASVYCIGDFTNRGTLILQSDSGLTVEGTLTLESGNLQLRNAAVAATSFLIQRTAQLSGTGTVYSNVENRGQLTVGEANTVGLLSIEGNYRQTPEGILNLNLGTNAAGEYDQLAVAGLAELAGTLNLVRLQGYQPTAGDYFVCMLAALRTGQFSTITPPPGMELFADYQDEYLGLLVL